MVVADVCMLDFFRCIHGNHMEDSARSQRTKQAALTRERYVRTVRTVVSASGPHQLALFVRTLATNREAPASIPRKKRAFVSNLRPQVPPPCQSCLPCPPTQNTTKQRCSASQRQRGPTTEAAAPPRIESARFSAPKKNGGYATRTPPHDDYRCRSMSSLPNGRHFNISS